ncbi:MAG: sulfatase [Saprospiraceae bacterium]|nr:sulfatase [Saprospiraceae bacterium]
MNSKSILAILVILIATVCQGSAQSRPNILFILADDMGWQDTSVPFGPETTTFNNRYKTPALVRLAADGMKFTQAYACAVCSPSRVSILTGQNAARHGVTQWTYLSGKVPRSDLHHPTLKYANWNWNGLQPASGMENAVFEKNLPQLLHEAGYRTMHFGKGHFGAAGTPGADPKNLGFDVRIGGRDAGGCGSYKGVKNFGAKANPEGPWRAWDLDHYFGQDIHLTEALTLEATREIRKAAQNEQPFFCYFAHYAPHTPIEADERFAQKYRSAGLAESEAAYASLIEGMDKSLGDLLDLLDELDLADNTMVIFTSDNGGLSHDRRSMSPPHTHNAPLSSGKGAHHEGGIRVPLIVKLPSSIPAEVSTSTPVMIFDWFPTILEIAGVNYSRENIDGISLVPLFTNQDVNAYERNLIWHFPNLWGPLQYEEPVKGPGMGPSSTIIKGKWKLICYYSDQRFELFNLSDDLGETTNLATEFPMQVKMLAQDLTDYLRDVNAPMLRDKRSDQFVAYPFDILK